jgi:hypothetical protein
MYPVENFEMHFANYLGDHLVSEKIDQLTIKKKVMDLISNYILGWFQGTITLGDDLRSIDINVKYIDQFEGMKELTVFIG